MSNRRYIIEAEYGSNIRYYIGLHENGSVYMSKLYPSRNLNSISYTLEQATRILHMYKDYSNARASHRLNQSPLKHEYVAKKIWLRRLTKLEKEIELYRTPTGKISKRWRL